MNNIVLINSLLAKSNRSVRFIVEIMIVFSILAVSLV